MAGAAVLGRLNWHVCTVVALRDETATARTIALQVPDWPGHVAGQRVDLRVTAADGYSAVREYSIASAWRADGRIELSIERLPDGEVSPYLTQDLMVGDRVELRGPIGGWFVWRDHQTEPIQLVAGRLRRRAAHGHDPIAWDSREYRPVSTVVLNQASEQYLVPRRITESDGEELTASTSTYVYTRSTPPKWSTAPRPRRCRASRRAASWPAALSPTCYVCGPTSFVERVAELLTASGHSAERIRTERFGPTGNRG